MILKVEKLSIDCTVFTAWNLLLWTTKI